MRLERFRWFLVAGLLLAGATGKSLCAQTGGFSSRATAGSSRASSQFLAIMGQIVRPGVYELPATQMQLLELIRLAGNVTANASGNVRIIRRGRGGQQAFLVPELKYELIPGDLVIVDRKPSMGDHRQVKSAPTRTTDSPAEKQSAMHADPYVQIGLVQLIPRPVVLDIPSRHATLGELLAALGQPCKGKGSITVIKPAGGQQVVSLDHAAKLELLPGCVVVFDMKSVQTRSLPRLPEPIRQPTEELQSAASALPPNDRHDLQRPAAGGSVSGRFSPTADEPSPLVPGLDADQIADRLHRQPPVDSEVRTPPALLSDGELEHDHADIPLGTEPQPVEIAARNQSGDALDRREEPASVPDSNPETDQPTPVSLTQESASWSGWALLLGGGLAGTAIWMLVFQGRERLRVPHQTSPQPGRCDNASLELLVSNRLTIVEELPILAAGATQLFGQPVLTTEFRLEAAHPLAGPHYEIPVVENSPAAPRNVSQPHAATAPSTVPRSQARNMRIDRPHLRDNASALDRALAAVQGDQP